MMTSQSGEQQPEIHLLGQRIPLKTLGTDPDSARAILALVSERLRSAEERLGKRSIAPHQVALLALLDLAEDYISAKNKVSDFQKKIQEKSDAILGRLDEGTR